MRIAQLLAVALLVSLLSTVHAATPLADGADYYIDAERLPTLIERAQLATDVLVGREGHWEDWLAAILETYGGGLPLPDSYLERADRALREGALSLLLLRNRVMLHDLVPRETWAEVHWPAWIMQPPGAVPESQVVGERLEWLAPLVYELTGKICEMAAKKTGTNLLHTVE